jgi:hypothetical protein
MKNSILISLLVILISSCDKGYEVRFSNYYIEPMDSVVIGDNKLVFTNVELQSSTEYRKINKGKYSITCISRTKKRFTSELNIPGKGSGKRTIQIDGINQISILEE